MDISSLGHAAFRIKGKNAIVITDPFDGSMVGFPFPKHQTADVVTVTHHHHDHDYVTAIEGTPFVVDGPGEYDIKGISVIGISSYHDNSKGLEHGKITMYRIEIDGVSILHLGDLGATLSTTEIEKLDGVDILMIPVGGDTTLDAAKAASLVAEFEPMIVIPMHYKTSKHNEKVFGGIAPVSAFLKAMGKEDIQPVAKLSVTKDKLPAEMQIVVLE